MMILQLGKFKFRRVFFFLYSLFIIVINSTNAAEIHNDLSTFQNLWEKTLKKLVRTDQDEFTKETAYRFKLLFEKREQYCHDVDVNSEFLLPTKYVYWVAKSPHEIDEIIASVTLTDIDDEFEKHRSHLLSVAKEISSIDFEKDLENTFEIDSFFSSMKLKIEEDLKFLETEKLKQKMKQKKRDKIKV